VVYFIYYYIFLPHSSDGILDAITAETTISICRYIWSCMRQQCYCSDSPGLLALEVSAEEDRGLHTWRVPHHAEGLVDPNFDIQKNVTGFRYPRAFLTVSFKNVSNVFYDLKNLAIATFYELKITFWKKLVEGAPTTFLHLIFSDSTLSGVSKTSYVFILSQSLGQQVPQHDGKCLSNAAHFLAYY
jgi:hypothetical protein